MDHPELSSPRVTLTHCANLRHKGMYVMGEIDPDEARATGPYDATAYWCARTQKGFGPDGLAVHPDKCRHGRECCE
ncbi:MAG TPA: hypothetical protein VNK92_02720 [Vicinamibacterales bacterium]|jgi:hypothetical protein|nr:hypothetical protein [Vicinamibacterales bacterium]